MELESRGCLALFVIAVVTFVLTAALVGAWIGIAGRVAGAFL